MMGLGDVASILIPAVKRLRQRHPRASLHVLTYGAGVELMSLVPEVDAVLAVTPAQWPNELDPAVQSFARIADVVVSQHFDRIVNLDTWFMPCFMARVLKDAGLDLQGNYLRLSTEAFFAKLHARQLTQDDFLYPERFLDSSFPNMADWTIPWWNKFPDAGAYPDFYLGHCCGLGSDFERTISIEPDLPFKQQAQGRKIVALSLAGSKASKQYRHAQALRLLLERAGHFVWGQFDGRVAMPVTLARLKVTDLLVTVPTSTQWLARLVGCPALLIPGPLPPRVLGPECVADRVLDCQYCYQDHCPEELNFSCMDVPPESIVAKVAAFFGA